MNIDQNMLIAMAVNFFVTGGGVALINWRLTQLETTVKAADQKYIPRTEVQLMKEDADKEHARLWEAIHDLKEKE